MFLILGRTRSSDNSFACANPETAYTLFYSGETPIVHELITGDAPLVRCKNAGKNIRFQRD